jgi:hypothetical protein
VAQQHGSIAMQVSNAFIPYLFYSIAWQAPRGVNGLTAILATRSLDFSLIDLIWFRSFWHDFLAFILSPGWIFAFSF